MNQELISETFLNIEYKLSEELKELDFKPIEYIYDPLKYAKDIHDKFVRKYFNLSGEKILFLGINPGPWGMCQTGIPFCESKLANEWFRVEGHVERPVKEHPKKKVTGLKCTRSEVSGKRFWGLFKKICGSPENFFRHCLICNHCPLAFFSKDGNNLTPKETKALNYKQLIKLCDSALIEIIKKLDIKLVIAIGSYAKERAVSAVKQSGIPNIKVKSIPHPSPKTRMSQSDWEKKTKRILKDLDVYQLLKMRQTTGN